MRPLAGAVPFMPDFDQISEHYEQDAIVQQSAGDRLLELLRIGSNDDVLDLGCGPGHLTNRIRERTSGQVTGVDPSPGMIARARKRYAQSGITFRTCAGEDLDYTAAFDRIFSNSAFQWFTDPGKALAACFRALRPGGLMAVQAPARDNYCPNFIRAVEAVRQGRITGRIFAAFTPPWFFLNSAEEYADLFAAAGFSVETARIDETCTCHTPAEVYRIFESGAAAGYLDESRYTVPLTQNYLDCFREIVKKSFTDQVDATGRVRLIFHRLYLVAGKQEGE